MQTRTQHGHCKPPQQAWLLLNAAHTATPSPPRCLWPAPLRLLSTPPEQRAQLQQPVLILPIRSAAKIVLRKILQPARGVQRRAAIRAPAATAAAAIVAAAGPAGRWGSLIAAGLLLLLPLAALACTAALAARACVMDGPSGAQIKSEVSWDMLLERDHTGNFMALAPRGRPQNLATVCTTRSRMEQRSDLQLRAARCRSSPPPQTRSQIPPRLQARQDWGSRQGSSSRQAKARGRVEAVGRQLDCHLLTGGGECRAAGSQG